MLMYRGLDLYCCAGLASDGYHAAGFTMDGVDVEPHASYSGLGFVDDALRVLRDGYIGVGPACYLTAFDFIHASPPCQLHTRAKHLRTAQGGTSKAIDLLTPTLALLRDLDIPWVCENVPGTEQIMAPREGEWLTTLCGSMFGLEVQRHRLFLTNWPLTAPGKCNHASFPLDPVSGKPRPWGCYHVMGDSIPKGGRTVRDLAHGKQVMGVPADREITWAELKEGLPVAYCEYIGTQLAATLDSRATLNTPRKGR
jgi:DNA (cytosine-5)-methyltransferase 1